MRGNFLVSLSVSQHGGEPREYLRLLGPGKKVYFVVDPSTEAMIVPIHLLRDLQPLSHAYIVRATDSERYLEMDAMMMSLEYRRHRMNLPVFLSTRGDPTCRVSPQYYSLLKGEGPPPVAFNEADLPGHNWAQ